ncbi:aspartyl-tRNA(Asn)/glutamyl-tRNA(Gln) amidotransferase subunit A [Sagittula marina]|uniref:Aspartyl-tRNA(Asn)/glutamyl-tRNA(Gln) amidotransferase subunit A n=1 Tax=Sagittula marina TaxID=943940 RepID=A0A7W6GR53_9RHOB|nr:amidase family protein [Sagittula marina]MBB3984317.1 aspartyl-tRNA(Asn)/glutamyl-tRNA(Gln) amidotransferase subunit A [Sagittula marina]
MTDWTKATAAEMGRAIGRGEVDPVDLTQGFYDAIAAEPASDRIYARLTEERAMAEALAASKRARDGVRRHPLDGVPISWKDLYDTAGVVTEAGSGLLAGRVPDRDAKVLRAATLAGTVCLGKTHMSELAFSGLGLNPVTATAPCVNDPEAVAGGSSSGAAASVAFGLAAAGIGSDTGGSVRLPACWNDLVGLKTSSGRLSLEGAVPLITSFDTVGPLARSVEDAALLLSAMEGKPAPDLRGASLKGRRFAMLQTVVMEDLDEAPARAFADAVARFRDAGAEVVELDFPQIGAPHRDSGMLYTVEAWATWGEAIKANPNAMFAPIRERFESGATHDAATYKAAWQHLEDVRRAWWRETASFDAVICPTAPNLPAKKDKLMEQGDYYVSENLRTLRNTRIGNLLGGGIVTLPTGVPSCGVSLMAPPMTEPRLLRLAHAAEAALKV